MDKASMLSDMPIVSSGSSGAANRGPGASVTADPAVYLLAARTAIQASLREWIRLAKFRGQFSGTIATFRPGCLTSTAPIALPVRDAMSLAGSPTLLAKALSEFIEVSWNSWASQLSASLPAFPVYEAYVAPNAPPMAASLAPVLLLNLSSPGNQIFAFSQFSSQLWNAVAPFLPSSASQTQVASHVQSGLSSTPRPVMGGGAVGNASTTAASRPVFAGVNTRGGPTNTMFCELGDWVSSCFDQWFLRADVRRITGYPKSARVVTMHGDLVQAIYRISGDCEGTLGGLYSFGESGI